jgi:uncharacterized protein YcsI (UPF0317 family)
MTTATMLPTQPAELRRIIRAGEYGGVTSGLANGHVQANLAVLPRDLAFDFLLFCQRNPQPCPLLEVLDAGDGEPRHLAPGADLRTDVPLYRVYRNGELSDETDSLSAYWRDDLVSFLLGCSFTFEHPLLAAGIRLKHWELGCNVPMYITNRACKPAGRFQGPMVVSMRPVPQSQVVRTVQITSRFPAVHGAPVHVGDPSALGIDDLQEPDFGDPLPVESDEVPVFWACGVTPQAVMMQTRPEIALTHSPGHMFITDHRERDLMAW